MDSDDTLTKKRPRGRPRIDPEPETVQAVIDYLYAHRGQGCTYVDACAAVGTSRHVMAKAMAWGPQVEFEIRLAVARCCRRRLAPGENWAISAVVDQEARLTAAGAPGRDWEALAREIEGMRAHVDARAAASAPVTIPGIVNPGDEAF